MFVHITYQRLYTYVGGKPPEPQHNRLAWAMWNAISQSYPERLDKE